MKSGTLLSAAFIGLMLTSCSKDNGTVTPDPALGTGSTSKEAAMVYELQATNTSSGVTQRTTAGGMLRWTSGTANPTQVKFEAKSKDTKIEYKSNSMGQVDLFAPSPIGFGGFMLPAGTYKEIELKIKLDNTSTTPALQLNGYYTDNVVTIPITFIIEEDVELKTELKNVTITDGTFAALTTLDLSTYTGSITEAMLRNAHLTNGTLVISRSSNRAVYDLIMNSLNSKRHRCEFKHKK
jgi:hypothetical protein